MPARASLLKGCLIAGYIQNIRPSPQRRQHASHQSRPRVEGSGKLTRKFCQFRLAPIRFLTLSLCLRAGSLRTRADLWLSGL